MAASMIGHLIVLPHTWSRIITSKLRERCCHGCSTALTRRDYSKVKEATTPEDDVQQIEIPDKIPRTPTSILEALASTVQNDVNRPPYLSMDDPAWVPYADSQLMISMSALESGRLAAKKMISMHPEYFSNFWEEEIPESMDIIKSDYVHQDPSEATLLERIARRDVKESARVYRDSRKAGVALSQEACEKLLELLTVFNEENPKEMANSVVSPAFTPEVPFPVSSWKKQSLSEEVFAALPEKTAKAHCLMIRGMAENFNKEGAINFYQTTKELNLPVDVFTYNKFLRLASLDVQSIGEVIEFIKGVFKDMALREVRPSAETFNSALKNCRRLSRWRGTKMFALELVSEMKACEIEPTLGTWAEILSIFYYHKDTTAKTLDIFEQMLDRLEGTHLAGSHETDFTFFRFAMRVIFTHFPDPQLALKLHGILQFGNNSDLLGHRQQRFSYYKDLMMVLAPMEHTDVLMEIYDTIAPFTFMPPIDVCQVIFENIEMNETYHYIPRLCADMEWSNLYTERLSKPLLATMTRKKQEEKLQSQFCNIASNMLEKCTEDIKKGRPFLDGGSIGDIVEIFLNGGQLKKAQQALQLYRNNLKLQNTEPSEKSITRLAEMLIEAKDFSGTKDLLTWMLDMNVGLAKLVDKAEATFDLGEQDRNYLRRLAADSIDAEESSSDSD